MTTSGTSKSVPPLSGSPQDLLPPVTDDNRPYWEGLSEGRLFLQVCASCHRSRFPIAPVCPFCGHDAHEWQTASGQGTVFSWVRYHRPYLPEFAPLLPYVVGLIELAEGPRVFARIAESGRDPKMGEPVTFTTEKWPENRAVMIFELGGDDL